MAGPFDRSPFSLVGKVAVVTGGNAGIGQGIALALAGAGAGVASVARRPSDDTVGQCLAKGGKAVSIQADLGSTEPVERVLAEATAALGPIDILVNNAGMQFRAPLEDFPVDAWDRLMATNVRSVFLVGQAVARHMIARRRGRIINVCSVQSELARPGIAPYTASKGAVRNLTKGMCTDWGRHGIQVNGLAPGYFKTELTAALVADAAFTGWLSGRTPAGRWGDVEELVGAAVFLASDAASFVNGHVLYVDGGITATL
jgi:gluconate 5-dehydrogenase